MKSFIMSAISLVFFVLDYYLYTLLGDLIMSKFNLPYSNALDDICMLIFLSFLLGSAATITIIYVNKWIESKKNKS